MKTINVNLGDRSYDIEIKRGLAKTALEPNGKIYFECNEYYTDKIALLLKNKGYQEIAIKKDFAEKDRMISAKWH